MNGIVVGQALLTALPRMDAPRPASGAVSHIPAVGIADLTRRALDVVVSVALLCLMLLPLLLVACLIKLGSPGPLLYRQDRVGLHGRVFSLLKLRSMRRDAERDGPCWAAERDPRVTPIGRLMRAYRLDEYPQLINVLRGEMSLIGPRPERPCFVKLFEQVIPHYHERASVLPGITGWAQVNHPYGASVEDTSAKLVFDLYYLRNRGLLLDLRILLATVQVVLFRIGAR